MSSRSTSAPFFAALLSFAGVLVSVTGQSGAAAAAAAKSVSTPVVVAKVGRPCKAVGQVAGTASNRLVCQTAAKAKLVWARNRITATSLPSATSTSADSFVATFRSNPSANSEASALALFNTQGVNGYAYIGPLFVAGSSHETFVKAEPNATYQYETVEMPAGVDALMALLQAKGKAGFLYKGPMVFGGAFDKTSLLFVRSNAKKTTYSYRNTPWPSEESIMLTELNANGADGYRYLGDLVPDPARLTVGIRLFAKDDQNAAKFGYSLKPQMTDREQFLAEATAMGQDKAVWKGGYVVGAGTPPMQIRSLYEKSSLTTKPVSFSFTSPVPSSIEALIANANENAKKGNLLWGQYILGTETVSVYSNAQLTNLPVVGVVLP